MTQDLRARIVELEALLEIVPDPVMISDNAAPPNVLIKRRPGLALAGTAGLDGAPLDVILAGEQCFPIADALAARGVPFAFLTGYGEQMLPPNYRHMPRLTKPFNAGETLGMVERCFVRG